jgi:hypothetical protein
MRWHVTNQDTFTVNGKTLVGYPCMYNVEWLLNSSGNLTPREINLQEAHGEEVSDSPLEREERGKILSVTKRNGAY